MSKKFKVDAFDGQVTVEQQRVAAGVFELFDDNGEHIGTFQGKRGDYECESVFEDTETFQATSQAQARQWIVETYLDLEADEAADDDEADEYEEEEEEQVDFPEMDLSLEPLFIPGDDNKVERLCKRLNPAISKELRQALKDAETLFLDGDTSWEAFEEAQAALESARGIERLSINELMRPPATRDALQHELYQQCLKALAGVPLVPRYLLRTRLEVMRRVEGRTPSAPVKASKPPQAKESKKKAPKQPKPQKGKSVVAETLTDEATKMVASWGSDKVSDHSKDKRGRRHYVSMKAAVDTGFLSLWGSDKPSAHMTSSVLGTIDNGWDDKRPVDALEVVCPACKGGGCAHCYNGILLTDAGLTVLRNISGIAKVLADFSALYVASGGNFDNLDAPTVAAFKAKEEKARKLAKMKAETERKMAEERKAKAAKRPEIIKRAVEGERKASQERKARDAKQAQASSDGAAIQALLANLTPEQLAVLGITIAPTDPPQDRKRTAKPGKRRKRARR